MMDPIINFDKFEQLPLDSYKLIEAGNDPSAFEVEHLENAIYFDLEDDLSSKTINPKNGGRHPLPTIDNFITKLSQSGICKDDHVIIYDRQQGSNSAARIWWMMTGVGIKNIQVLSGGYQYALQRGFRTTNNTIQYHPVDSWSTEDWMHPTIHLNQLREINSSDKSKILDVRSQERYRGEIEPIDPIAGHIPNAFNIYFKENLNQDGTFKTKEEIKELYADFTTTNSIIVHCGSGVTACHTILSMVYAELPMPILYIGSWSEWCRNM